MGEGEKNDLLGANTTLRQKVGDAGRQCRGFAGAGGGENAEILVGWLADNAGLFVVESQCTFAEDECVHSSNYGCAS